jgi:hypothetical protein
MPMSDIHSQSAMLSPETELLQLNDCFSTDRLAMLSLC